MQCRSIVCIVVVGRHERVHLLKRGDALAGHQFPCFREAAHTAFPQSSTNRCQAVKVIEGEAALGDGDDMFDKRRAVFFVLFAQNGKAEPFGELREKGDA